METVTTVVEVKNRVRQWKKEGKTIGFVPTMGFLHKGHGSLIERARLQNDRVVVSIFVNPMQFGKNEDFSSYPRDVENDRRLCELLGVDIIFQPSASEIYNPGFCSYIDMTGLTENLCGTSRPGHFRGVCTVVAKLFNIITPDRAYFGEKDAQQLAVVRHMAHDLNLNVEIVGCPIIREADGLALSSRNKYLNDDERKAALVLSRALRHAEELIKSGVKDSKEVVSAMIQMIQSEPLANIDYIKAVDALQMKDKDIIEPRTLIAVAVYIGKTRLIDNLFVR